MSQDESQPSRHARICVSRLLALEILKACGISPANVTRVELDLSEPIAQLKVTSCFPSDAIPLLVSELAAYDLVPRSDEGPARAS